MIKRMLNIFTDEDFKEIFYTVIISFIPLIISAGVASAIAKIGPIKAFFGYFSSGELGLYVLSTCGALAFILVIKTRVRPSGDNFWIFLLSFLIPVLVAAVILGSNPQFKDTLPISLHVVLLIVYIVALWGWFKALKIKKDADEKLERAQNAVKNASYSSDEERDAVLSIIGD